MKDKTLSLYEFGDPRNLSKNGQWPDYLQEGFTDADIPALIGLVIDPAFDDKPFNSNEVWVPLHAWRILGQLKTTKAIQPLINMLDKWEENDDDWALSEIPHVLGMIGSSAIDPLLTYSKEKNHHEFSLVIAFDSLKEIAIAQPAFRSNVLEVYRQYMLKPDTTKDSLNGLLVSFLLDLKATELIDEIRTLFNQDCVDSSVAGDLEDIEVELGFRTGRTTPRPHFGLLPGLLDEIGSRPDKIQGKTKVGRNAPCPCGSGKKFKKCCLN